VVSWILKKIKKLYFIVKFLYKVLELIVKIASSGVILLKATGRFAGYVMAYWKQQVHYIRRVWKEKYPSEEQLEIRKQYRKADQLWRDLEEWEKNKWREIAKGKGISNYAAFMRENLNRLFHDLPMIRVPEERG